MTSFAASDADIRYSPLSRHFADFMIRLHGTYCPELYLAAFLVTDATLNGHICLNLRALEKQVFHIDGFSALPSPPTDSWSEILKCSPVVGTPGDFKPLILDDADRLYTYRYWHYEKSVAERVIKMAGRRNPSLASIRPESCVDLLLRLFPEVIRQKGLPPGQVIAALIALTRDFCLISGSPGTGKTTAVARILAFILELTNKPDVRIALSAPTAKAAIRLQEAISRAKQTLPCAEHIKSQIPEQAATIHRLLKSTADGARYHYGQNNPLPYDIVVVDEASMIDLPLMCKLLEALPLQARLILVGDPDQLPSVETGNVLRACCDAIALHPDNARHRVHLERVYRQDTGSDIALAAQTVLSGDGAHFIEGLQQGLYRGVHWQTGNGRALEKIIADEAVSHYQKMRRANSLEQALRLGGEFRVLCAARESGAGSIAINRYIADRLKKKSDTDFYQGRLCLVTENTAREQLFNGDVGLCWPDEHGILRIWVETAAGLKAWHPANFPAHEDAYAITVHKSQGSEFERVLLVLPDSGHRVLSRELLYTGITRAKKRIDLCADQASVMAAIFRQNRRWSLLSHRLSQNAH